MNCDPARLNLHFFLPTDLNHNRATEPKCKLMLDKVNVKRNKNDKLIIHYSTFKINQTVKLVKLFEKIFI